MNATDPPCNCTRLTRLQILDFGAIRDGQPPEDLGKRVLLNEHEVREIIDEGPA